MASSGTTVNAGSDTVRTLPVDRVQDLLKLQKAAHKINSILDLDQLIDKIANDIARSFGCVELSVFLHEAERGEMVLAGVHGCTLHGKGHRLKIGRDGLVGYVAATGQMRYAPDVRRDAYYMACEENTLSEVAIPLQVDGQLVGVFTASHPEVDGFPADQLRLLQGLCSHIAVAVQNARRFQQERSEREQMSREAQEARSIQQALLPKSSPFIPGFAVSGLSIPAGPVGGDWYDFIDLGDGRWGLVLADVSGKGTAAALLMSATRAMARSLAENSCSPAEVLTKLNRLLVEDFPSGRFVTMVYGVLDPARRTLQFANAGHLPPVLAEASGARFLETEMGLPLGIRHGTYSEATVPLTDGARIVLYSDGITEATNPDEEEYGAARLAAHLQHWDASMESLLQDVRTFANGAGLRDDATVVVVRINPAPVLVPNTE
ncbi:MAG TPA: PP2C family protein-serine/threonine phosphatase [Terriglobales bacterium]|nr:PP2C family protein-serine/threonine phosphatase [Terriglobales bacterium]